MTQLTHRNEQTGDAALDRIQNNVRDLVEYVRGLFWLTRRAYVEQEVALTISSSTYITLLTTTINTSLTSGYLLIHFTVSGVKVTTTGYVSFEVEVDGTVIRGTSTEASAGRRYSAAIVVRAAVSKGVHTVKVLWFNDVGTSRIDPTVGVEEHASLYVEELAA